VHGGALATGEKASDVLLEEALGGGKFFYDGHVLEIVARGAGEGKEELGQPRKGARSKRMDLAGE
jgi:hypothetical protein